MKQILTLVFMMLAMYGYSQILNIYTKGASFPISSTEIDSIQFLPVQQETNIDVKAVLESSEEGWCEVGWEPFIIYKFHDGLLETESKYTNRVSSLLFQKTTLKIPE